MKMPHDPAGQLHMVAEPGTATSTNCPKCLAPITVFALGCPECVAAVALLYAAHLAEQHPEFIQQIRSELS